MSAVLRRPMTLDAFLDWEGRQETRHEFDGFGPVAMTGGTAAHARIQRNLAIAVGGRLRGGPCEFLGSDIRLVTERTVRYPDGVVTCSALGNGATAVVEPVVVFEVLSRGTYSTDHIVKNREYAGIPSVRRYVMLEQQRIGATVFAWEGGDWKGEVLGADSRLRMPEIGLENGIELPLAELYEGLEFPNEEGGGAGE